MAKSVCLLKCWYLPVWCVMPCHVVSCHTMLYHVMSCHIMICCVMSCHICYMSCHMSCLFYNKDPEDFFYYSIVWGTVYSRGMGHRGTLRPLNKLALPKSPLQATWLKIYAYLVNFFREIYNTPYIINQLIYIS